jgi:hypothetical protein
VSTAGNVADFEPGQILRALEAHHVRYVVIGAIAAIAAGAPILTTDLDVTPARSHENLERLALALRDLDAKLRSASAPAGVSFPIEAEMLATTDSWTLTTRVGDVDLMFLPAGTRGRSRRCDPLQGGRQPREGQHAATDPAQNARADPRARKRTTRPRAGMNASIADSRTVNQKAFTAR